MNGLIIIGYPGIGKTSVVKNGLSNRIIDFESSLFKVNDVKIDNWCSIYCKQAVSMAKQGFIVLISSHKCVREELANYDQDGFTIVTIAPSYSLKDEWIDRLKDRYKANPCERNLAAWKNAERNFTNDIADIASECTFSHIFINSMDYSLRLILSNLQSIYSSRASYRDRRLSYEKYED